MSLSAPSCRDDFTADVLVLTSAFSHDSKFAAAYTKGMKKAEYWQPTLEDSLDLVAKSFTVAARSSSLLSLSFFRPVSFR